MGSVQFWKMMGSILGVDGGLPHALNMHRIAAVPPSLAEGSDPKEGTLSDENNVTTGGMVWATSSHFYVVKDLTGLVVLR